MEKFPLKSKFRCSWRKKKTGNCDFFKFWQYLLFLIFLSNLASRIQTNSVSHYLLKHVCSCRLKFKKIVLGARYNISNSLKLTQLISFEFQRNGNINNPKQCTKLQVKIFSGILGKKTLTFVIINQTSINNIYAQDDFLTKAKLSKAL